MISNARGAVISISSQLICLDTGPSLSPTAGHPRRGHNDLSGRPQTLALHSGTETCDLMNMQEEAARGFEMCLPSMMQNNAESQKAEERQGER